jgi:hypothetical protein
MCSANSRQLRAQLEDHAAVELWSQKQRSKVENCIDGLLETKALFDRARDNGVGRLLMLLKPRVQAQLESTLGSSSTSFELAAGEFEALNAGNDPYVRALLQLVEAGLSHVAQHLDFENKYALTQALAAFVAKAVEHTIVRKRFSQFGALLLDRQLRDIRAFFARRCSLSTDPFRRMSEIVALLSLDRVEDLHDVYSGDAANGLANKEVKRVLALRSDFKTDDIKRLKI